MDPEQTKTLASDGEGFSLQQRSLKFTAAFQENRDRKVRGTAETPVKTSASNFPRPGGSMPVKDGG